MFIPESNTMEIPEAYLSPSDPRIIFVPRVLHQYPG